VTAQWAHEVAPDHFLFKVGSIAGAARDSFELR